MASSPESRDNSLSPEPPDLTSSLSLTSSLGESSQSADSGQSSRLRPLRPVWRSPVWAFFVISEVSKYARCNKCLELVARGGNNAKSYNTSNLVHHLRSHHSREYAQLTDMKKDKEKERDAAIKERAKASGIAGLRQLTLQKTEDCSKPWDINHPRAKQLHKKLGEMIALDNQPISMVEDTGFVRFVETLQPQYKIPSRKYFAETIIPSILADVKTGVEKKLYPESDNFARYYSFTTDIWSCSMAGESLLSLTAHWISADFEKVSAVLHVLTLEGSHTGVYICEKFKEMLSNWNINKEHVHLVLRDNASNMEKAMRDADLNSYGCFAHTLQLVVKDGVISQRAVSDLLAVCRTIVGHFKHSTIAYDKLKAIQQRLDLPQHHLKQDEPTRWNTSLYMLESIIEQKVALAAYGVDGSIPLLTASQLDTANKVVKVLKPVEEITKCISKDEATISLIIPLVCALQKTLEEHDDDSGVRRMKAEMLNSLQRRYSDMETTDCLALATIIDPRFKDKSFSSSYQDVKALLQEKYKEWYELVQEPLSLEPPTAKRVAVDTAKESRLWGCLSEILSKASNPTDVASNSSENEVNQYLCETLLDFKTGNPLKWWKCHHQRFPVLAKIAQRYLSAPPTSVPSERLFSGAGLVYNDRRSRLNPNMAESLLLIRYNLPLVQRFGSI